MADAKVTALTALAAADLATGDQLLVSDVSETQSKSITAEALASGLHRLGPTRWRDVGIMLGTARRCTIASPTSANSASISALYEQIRSVDHDNLPSPAALIASETPDATGQPAPQYGYDGANATIRLGVEGFKPSLQWNLSTPNTVGAFLEFHVPYDMAVVGGLSSWRLQGRMVVRGSGTLAADKNLRIRMAAENGGADGGLSPSASYNFGPYQLPDYTFASGSAQGDYTNLDFDASATQDGNGRCLKPGDRVGMALWFKEAQESLIACQVWWLNFRYLAVSSPEVPS